MTMSRTAPINGEILVEATHAGAGAAASRDAVAEDAEFITLDDDEGAAWPTPDADEAVPPPQGASLADGLGILRASKRADGEAWRGQLGNVLYGLVFVLAVGATFWFSGGYALVGTPAKIVRDTQVLQVRIARAESRFAERDGSPDIILINGTVANDSVNAQGVPPIAVRVTASSGRSQRYVFGTQNRILNGGQSMDFAYRLDAPAGGVKNVEIVLAENR